MAKSSGVAVTQQELAFQATVTAVISSTVFDCNLTGQGENRFMGWDCYVVRKATGTGAAPQDDRVAISTYVSNTGRVTLRNAFNATQLSVGDTVYLQHPSVSENDNIIVIASDNLKQSSDTEVTTVAAALAVVKSLAFTGRQGGCRVKFDMRVDNAAGTATAVIYKNGVAVVTNPSATPVYTAWTDVTAVYHTYTQDIGGLAAGDLVQIYAMASAGRITYIRNFQIYYDISHQPASQALLDVVYYDEVNGYAGTDWPVGSAEAPSNSEADVITMLQKRNQKKVMVIGGVFYAPSDLHDINFLGNNRLNSFAQLFPGNIRDNIIDLDGHTLSRCSFKGISVFDDNVLGTINDCSGMNNCGASYLAGSMGTVRWVTNCDIIVAGNMTAIEFAIDSQVTVTGTITLAQHLENCLIVANTINTLAYARHCTIGATASIAVMTNQVHDCQISTPAITLPNDQTNCAVFQAMTLNFTGATGNTVHNYKGFPVTFTNLTGAFTLNVSGEFTLTIAASCTAGIINVYGNVRIINNSGGTIVNDYTNHADADDIYNIVNAELVTQETGGTITTTGAEQDVYINNAPAGVFEPLVFKIDTTNLTAGGPDSVEIKVYERIVAGGGWIEEDVVDEAGNVTVYTDVQAKPLKAIKLNPNRYGIRVTITRTAGADHDYTWEVLHRS